jgi:hypothetical protein
MDESKDDCGSFVVLNIKLNGENLEYTFLRPFDFVINLDNHSFWRNYWFYAIFFCKFNDFIRIATSICK